jgi:glutamate synthase domain-containing protein 3
MNGQPPPTQPDELFSMADSASAPITIDLRSVSVTQLNQQLRAINDEECEVQVTGGSGQQSLCAGIPQSIKLTLQGTAGSYFGMLNGGADLDLHGDAGSHCGYSMNGGAILVRGSAGSALAALARGGFIGVHGAAKDACGLGLAGADVIVRQTVGARAGQAMRSGNLILGNDAGADLGLDATGGTIYLRGEAASIADYVREVKMKDSDSMRLGLLLVRAGIRAATKEFRCYRPRLRGDG